MSYISGWLALVGLVLLVSLVVYVIRHSPKQLQPAGPSVKVTASQSSGQGSKRSILFTVIKWLAIILLALLIIWYTIPLFGWTADTFMHTVVGDTIVQSSQRANVGTAAIRYTNELPCPPWDRKRHVCTLTGTTDIVQAPGLPAGLTFCMTPGPDKATTNPADHRWKSIRAILDSGDRVDLDPDHPLDNLAGYELTPTHRLPIVYWFSDSPSCT